MNARQLFSIAGAAALLAAPVAASAQQQPYGWSQNANAQVSDRRFYAAVRALDLRPDQRAQIRSIERSNNGQDVRREIVGVLDQNQRRELFRRLGYANNGNGYGYGNGNGNGYGRGNGNNGKWNGNGNNGNWNGQGVYGDRRGGMRDAQISGVVASFGGYNLQLRNGTAVSLHQGTIINPTGTTLAPGMRVAIRG
ncbi:MAG: hypothetical protein QOI11_2460, partial [Candidatus Eremiobacteraeota bacterium]|nr:hypothetical protein [Candidatus Eremiobacteraeota bacterium]